MYKRFFDLAENPFKVNPDPRFLFLTRQTREALDELTYGIQARKGLILLTGEVGTGKTTLLNRLLEWLRMQRTPTAFIFNSHLESRHLFDFILADFGVPPDPSSNGSAMLRLNSWLIERYRADETPVLIVDEAQGLSTQVLEEIRMLLNLETPNQKLLQIVLAGQPELEVRLKRPELRQLKQRIMLRCKTAALTLEETHEYVQARLTIAGANGKPIFAPEAVDAVHLYSRGIPRVVNLLCEHALINGYVENERPVPASMIGEIAREFQFDDVKPISGYTDSGDAMTSKLIAMQTTLANALAKAPTPAALSADAQTGTPMDGELNSFTPAQLLQADASAPPKLAQLEIPDWTTAYAMMGLPLTEEKPYTSGHQLRVVEGKASFKQAAPSVPQPDVAKPNERTAIASGGKKSILAGSRRAVSGGFSSLLVHRVARWKDHLVAAIPAVDWALIQANLRRYVNRPARSARELYRKWIVWLNRRPAAPALSRRTPPKFPGYRWLQEPWTPNIPIFSSSRFYAVRRKLAQKKIHI